MDKPEIQLAPSIQEVQMIEAEVVRQIRELNGMGWGAKRISKELGVSKNTVKRYLRGGSEAETQVRPKARRLDEDAHQLAINLYVGAAGGNASVVRDILRERGIEASLRTEMPPENWTAR